MNDMRAALVLHTGPVGGTPPRVVAFTDDAIDTYVDVSFAKKPAVVMHAHGQGGETVTLVFAPDVAQLLGQHLELKAMEADPSLIDMRPTRGRP